MRMLCVPCQAVRACVHAHGTFLTGWCPFSHATQKHKKNRENSEKYLSVAGEHLVSKRLYLVDTSLFSGSRYGVAGSQDDASMWSRPDLIKSCQNACTRKASYHSGWKGKNHIYNLYLLWEVHSLRLSVSIWGIEPFTIVADNIQWVLNEQVFKYHSIFEKLINVCSDVTLEMIM